MDLRRRVGTRRAVRLIVAVIGVACVGSGSREWTRAVGTMASASAVGQVDDGVARLKGTVWVVNRDRGELAIFDVDTGNVLATRPVGAGAHDICISEQAGKAYITAETIGIVTTVDLETLAMESNPGRSAAAPCRAEPRRTDHLRQPGLAQRRRGHAAVCGDRHRDQPRQLWAYERQRSGTIARAAPVARR